MVCRCSSRVVNESASTKHGLLDKFLAPLGFLKTKVGGISAVEVGNGPVVKVGEEDSVVELGGEGCVVNVAATQTIVHLLVIVEESTESKLDGDATSGGPFKEGGGGDGRRREVQMPRYAAVRDKNDVITLCLQGGGRDN
jgi:hypothetical protein